MEVSYGPKIADGACGEFLGVGGSAPPTKVLYPLPEIVLLLLCATLAGAPASSVRGRP